MSHDLSLWSLCGCRSQCVRSPIHLVYFPWYECSDPFVGVCPGMCICHRDWGLWSVCGYMSLDAISLKYLWGYISVCVVDIFVRMWQDVRSVLSGRVFPRIWILWAVFVCVCVSGYEIPAVCSCISRMWGPCSVWVCMSHDLRSLNYLMFCIQQLILWIIFWDLYSKSQKNFWILDSRVLSFFWSTFHGWVHLSWVIVLEYMVPELFWFESSLTFWGYIFRCGSLFLLGALSPRVWYIWLLRCLFQASKWCVRAHLPQSVFWAVWGSLFGV